MISAFCSENEWKLQQKFDWKRQLLFHFHHLPDCSILSTWDSTEKTLAGKGNQRKVCCKHHVLKISSCFTNSICITFSCPEGWGEKIKQKKKTSKQRNLLIRIPGAKSWILLWHQSEFQRYIGEAGSKEWEKQCEFWRREVSESKERLRWEENWRSSVSWRVSAEVGTLQVSQGSMQG